jgi:ATP-dependent RNA helicase DDX24/MAK5
VVVDVTSEKKVAARLVEARVECLKTDKDLYVYYLVTRYPGRTIIFVNSIDAIRRLVPVFRLLGVEVLGLHAQMQQKQRLKNLDR